MNARDLGGYATRIGGQTRWKSLLRADDLSQLTPDSLQGVLDYGVHTVIDLRWPGEAAKFPNPFQSDSTQVQFFHISLLGPSRADWVTRCPEGVPKELWNCAVLDQAQVEICQVLSVIAKAPERGVLFHCVAGKDRTGLIAALLLAAADVEPEVIANDYCLSADNLRGSIIFKDFTPEQMPEVLRCPPEQVYNTLTHLDTHYGGVSSYLGQIGLSEFEIARLKDRLKT